MIYKLHILILLLFYAFQKTNAQPNYYAKQQVEGVAIYQDLVKNHVFYYAPSNLNLKTYENNKPAFQLLQMRYTGTKCYNSQGKSHFTNLAKLTIEMGSYNPLTLKKIKATLKKSKTILLKPLPISNIESQLILPIIEDDGTIKKEILGENGALESTNTKGLSSSKTYWSSRVFTVKLTNTQADLLSSQLKKNQLAISFEYSFYANMPIKPIAEMELTGDNEALKAVESTIDTVEINKNVLVKSNTFQIAIDSSFTSEVIKTVDLNEQIPPAYAAIEVKCYDFSENLRPDLYLKKVEISAKSVSGDKDVVVETKFFKKNAELTTQYIHFPYAIHMDSPMKYRVTEITTRGEERKHDWKIKEECNELINITTPENEINIKESSFDIELDETIFEDETVKNITIKITFLLNNKKHSKEIIFNRSEEILEKNITFFHDKNTVINYFCIKKLEDNSIKKSITKTLDSDFIFVSKDVFLE